MKKLVVVVLILLGAAGVSLFAVRIVAARRARVAVARPAAVQRPVVEVALPTRRDVVERVVFTGTVRPRNEVDVSARVPGRLERVLVDVGSVVRKGELLAVVEHRELELAAGQARAHIDVAAAAIEQTKVVRDAASRHRVRVRSLREQSMVNAAELEQAETGLAQAEAAVRAAEAQLRVARAATGLATEALAGSRIEAPIAGVITRRHVGLGARVAPGQPLFQVQDASVLEVEGAVPAEELVRLSLDQPAIVTVSDLPGRSFPGHVATRGTSLDAVTRRATVKVVVDPAGGALLSNMFARVSVEVGRVIGALVVPATALVRDDEGPALFVFQGGKAVRVRPVLGVRDGDHVPVLSGLDERAKVLVSGQIGLADGAAVDLAPVRPE
ncbi:MAG: efflux RND transporter periplasmic adaptor subunit [Myxococcales bacterium]|nr:efflux RND transporter periplasmic adaptor subunit [Myxococcales bacterium]